MKLKRRLERLWQELNDFLSSTSIHGLSYLHLTQSRTTRIIWAVLVAAALTTATVLLVQTVGDWGTKHVTTTLQMEGLDSFPFPAVTFRPGKFFSENDFLRFFLNQFQITRYNQSSPLNDNDIFYEQFRSFLIFKDRKSLFYWIDKHLKEEKIFVKKKRGIFRKEVCSLLALVSKDIIKFRKLKKDIIQNYDINMFKFKGFSKVRSFMKTFLSPMIEELIRQGNVSNTEINSLCKAKENEPTKSQLGKVEG